MKNLINLYTTATPHREQIQSRLLQEIAYLEARLVAIGHTGDCAYEKAMARSYRQLLTLRRHEFATTQHLGNNTPINAFLAQSADYLQLPY